MRNHTSRTSTMAKFLPIALFVTTIGGIICANSMRTNNQATELYSAHNLGDSVKFVNLYAQSDRDVIRAYTQMIKDSIRIHKELQAEQSAAVSAWNNRK